MPMSSSGAFCYTLCQTASIVSATMASSPMATAPTTSLSVSGCSIAVIMTVQRAPSHHATSQNPQDPRIDRGMIQDGKLRGFAMGHAISVRTDYTAVEVCRFAQRAKDAAQARRLLAIAAIPTYRGTF